MRVISAMKKRPTAKPNTNAHTATPSGAGAIAQPAALALSSAAYRGRARGRSVDSRGGCSSRGRPWIRRPGHGDGRRDGGGLSARAFQIGDEEREEGLVEGTEQERRNRAEPDPAIVDDVAEAVAARAPSRGRGAAGR